MPAPKGTKTTVEDAPRPSVALVGLMGSGKSLVGRRLANRLHVPFVDSDTEIEKLAGITIPEIFDIAGEAKFRELEERAISTALAAGPLVLSTGGGAICNPQTAALLLTNMIVVWLKAEPETLLSRIGSTASRPLLHGPDPLDTLRRLAESRETDYSKAHLTIATDGLSGHEATLAVIRALDSHLAVT